MMKNNHLIRLLLPVVAAVALGCGWQEKPQYTTQIRIVNRTSHEMQIHKWVIVPQTFELAVGGTYSRTESQAGQFLGSFPVIYGSEYVVRFGADVATLHLYSDGGAYHNMCDYEAYVRSEPDRRHEVFTFTFTDADYEHALLHPYRPNEDMNR